MKQVGLKRSFQVVIVDKFTNFLIIAGIIVGILLFVWGGDWLLLAIVAIVAVSTKLIAIFKVADYYLCPSCNRWIDSREIYCSGCGTKLPWEEKGKKKSQK